MKNNNFKKIHQGPKRRDTSFGPDIIVVVFLDGGSSSPSCKYIQLLVLVQKKERKNVPRARDVSRLEPLPLLPLLLFFMWCGDVANRRGVGRVKVVWFRGHLKTYE